MRLRQESPARPRDTVCSDRRVKIAEAALIQNTAELALQLLADRANGLGSHDPRREPGIRCRSS